jgi:hypothetical protein
LFLKGLQKLSSNTVFSNKTGEGATTQRSPVEREREGEREREREREREGGRGRERERVCVRER